MDSMTTADSTPKTHTRKRSYNIAELLANSIQPFDDLAAEELAALSRNLDPSSGLTIAILSTTGKLMDGTQRLRALQESGHETVPGANIVIDKHSNADNEYQRAVMFNAQRRQLTGEAKAKAARRIMKEKGVSQNTVAGWFGISSSALSQLMTNYPDSSGPAPKATVGKDGKSYNRAAQPQAKARPPAYAKGNKPVPAGLASGTRKGDGLQEVVDAVDAGIDAFIAKSAPRANPAIKEAIDHADKLLYYVTHFGAIAGPDAERLDVLHDKLSEALVKVDEARRTAG
jgi:hypothetical protein